MNEITVTIKSEELPDGVWWFATIERPLRGQGFRKLYVMRPTYDEAAQAAREMLLEEGLI